MLQNPASRILTAVRLSIPQTLFPLTRLVSIVFLIIVTGLTATIADAAYDEIGGDDVRVATAKVVDTYPEIDIAENGDIYIALSVDLTGRHGISIYRSQDGGDQWSYWGGMDSTGVDYAEPNLHIAEGERDRIYVAFSYKGPMEAHRQIRVAFSPLTSASWTTHTALSSAADDFHNPCLNSDEMNFSAFRLYLAAEGHDGNGHDIWFTRSGDYGSLWDAGYKIASLATGDDYVEPFIAYGRLGVVHCVWTFNPNAGGTDRAIRYRRALNYAAGGIADWEPTIYLTSNSNGVDEHYATVAGIHGNDRVVISNTVTVGGGTTGSEIRGSSDAGGTWSTPLPFDREYLAQLLAYPSGSGCSMVGDYMIAHTGLRDASVSDPLTWSDNMTIVDRYYSNTWLGGISSNRQHDYNVAKENRRGVVWLRSSSTSDVDTVFFDAEWRRDPGYANLEAGFPMALTSGVVAPPAICELDGSDAESEIVFGDVDGRIIAVNHDGSPVPGWPVDIGTFQPDATIAVGSITGNSDNEVVAGNSAGVIHAFDAGGNELPGWPRDMGTAAPCYVALGGITTTARQVVACSGTRLALYDGGGVLAPGFPVVLSGAITASPAIGDVDGDGDRDIVILQHNYMNVIRGNGSVQAFRNVAADGQTFSNAPTLADLNLDGDLEIMAPTDQGRLYVMNPDGTNYPGGWPYVDPSGVRLTSVALAHTRGTVTPELIFNVEGPANPKVHAFFENKVELTGFPTLTDPAWYLYGMPIVDLLNQQSPDVIVGTRDMDAYSWDNFGVALPGWPEHLYARCNVSPASGDIDADGRVEVVFTTYAPPQLIVYDLGGAVYRSEANPTLWWPMYGYNALRQGCLACDNDHVTGVDDAPPIASITLAAPTPNPTSGALSLNFQLPEPAAVRLDVLDVQGRLIDHVLREELPAGPHKMSWTLRNESGTAPAAGVYYLKLVVNGPTLEREFTRKVVVVP